MDLIPIYAEMDAATDPQALQPLLCDYLRIHWFGLHYPGQVPILQDAATSLPRLLDEAWINDDIIDRCFEMMQHRSDVEGRRHIFVSSFLKARLEIGDSPVRWFRNKINLIDADLMFLPLNIGTVHWILGLINLRTRSITIYDGEGGQHFQVASMLLKCVQDVLAAQLKCEKDVDRKTRYLLPLKAATWTIKMLQGQRQTDSHSSGPLMIAAADCLRAGRQQEGYDETDMAALRKMLHTMFAQPPPQPPPTPTPTPRPSPPLFVRGTTDHDAVVCSC